MPEVVQGARRAVTLYARRRRGRVVNAKRAEWTSWPWRHSKPAARGARRRRAPGALWLHGDGGAGRAQLMAAAAAERAKLAVHCHAGLGRTGWAPLAAARRQGCRPNVCSLCGPLRCARARSPPRSPRLQRVMMRRPTRARRRLRYGYATYGTYPVPARRRLAIACYLVYMGGHGDATAVIALVRRRRPGALQTPQQERFVDVFACYVRHLRCAPSRVSSSCCR